MSRLSPVTTTFHAKAIQVSIDPPLSATTMVKPHEIGNYASNLSLLSDAMRNPEHLLPLVKGMLLHRP